VILLKNDEVTDVMRSSAIKVFFKAEKDGVA